MIKLTIHGVQYQLIGEIGRGGSSVVYKAQRFPDGRIFVVKELFPAGLATRNETTGEVVPLIGKEKKFNEYKLRAKDEVRRAKEIGTNDDENNDPWLLWNQDPVEQNGTLYTVIDTEAGFVLQSITQAKTTVDRKEVMRTNAEIEEADFPKDFAAVGETVLRILEATEIVHRKNYLHLDISPDNLHFSRLKVAGKRVVRLIDYNSAYRIGDDYQDYLFSIKEGYSAPELVSVYKTKSPVLTCATDLYSITTIFFELLNGRTLEQKDLNKPQKRTHLASESPYLRGASALLVRETNAVLAHGLDYHPLNRFQSVDELRERIEFLLNLARKITLVNDPEYNPGFGFFVPRDDDCRRIHRVLCRSNYAILSGIGGIGKSELAKYYAKQYRSEYDIVQFINFTDNIKNTVVYHTHFHNFHIEQYAGSFGHDVTEQAYGDLLKALSEHKERTLLIIDNFDTLNDPEFFRFAVGKYKVIFTTRQRYDFDEVEHGNTVEITEIHDENGNLDMERIMQIFTHWYPAKNDAEMDCIEKIIALSEGHTLTVELSAKTARKNTVPIAEIYQRLSKSFNPHIENEKSVNIVKDYTKSERKMFVHIMVLFDLSKLDKAEKIIMSCMSLVPVSGIPYPQCVKMVTPQKIQDDVDFADSFRSLLNNGWVTLIGGGNAIYSHAVIADVVFNVLKPQIAFAPQNDFWFQVYGKMNVPMSWSEKLQYAEINRQIFRRFISAAWTNWFTIDLACKSGKKYLGYLGSVNTIKDEFITLLRSSPHNKWWNPSGKEFLKSLEEK